MQDFIRCRKNEWVAGENRGMELSLYLFSLSNVVDYPYIINYLAKAQTDTVW